MAADCSGCPPPWRLDLAFTSQCPSPGLGALCQQVAGPEPIRSAKDRAGGEGGQGQHGCVR